jgi:hypothetical protein
MNINYIKCKTNNFGEIIFDGFPGHSTSLIYKNKKIDVAFHLFIELTETTLKRSVEIIDKYSEIYEMTKTAIIEKYPENETISNFFKSHFELMNDEQLLKIFGTNDFNKLNINNAVEKLEYPRFFFDTCISKEIFLLVQYFNFLPTGIDENNDIGLWVEIDFDNGIKINDFVPPY